MVGGRVEQLHEALDAFASEDARVAAQADVVLELERARTRLEAEISRRLVAMANSGEHAAYGCKTVKQFLVARTRCAGGEAFRRVRTAKQLAELPATLAAWHAGEITTGHAEVIARAR